MKAMIFAAGIGSRLQPLTLEKPKALVEVGGVPMLEHVIRHLVHYGFNDIIINLHHFPDQIRDFLKNKSDILGARITYSDETDELLDTGGGLKKASWFFDKNAFLVYNVDVLTNLNLWKLFSYHRQKGGIGTLVVRKRESSRYLLLNKKDKLIGWENIQDKKRSIVREGFYVNKVAFSGIHVLEPSIFEHFPEEKKFSIIDAYLRIAKNSDIYGFTDNQSYWFDIGDLAKLKKASNFIHHKQ